MSKALSPSTATSLALPAVALAAALALLGPAEDVRAYSKLGENLNVSERDVRVFDNFQDASANDNQIPHPNFPGWLGVEQAVWKGIVEWGTGHGDGSGDTTQSNLGDGNANFEPAWMGSSTGVGTSVNNVVSGISSCGGSTLAFAEVNFADGWRIRFCENITWSDGPGNVPGGQFDLQGVMVHEYGHALGLGHSGVSGATMWPSTSSGSESARSINSDDAAGLQCIYGARRADKPTIDGIGVAGGVLTISGSFFTPTDNEVWFTPGSPTTPTSDPRVRVLGLDATNGGTEISVVVPAEAGPGAVQVRIGDVGHYSLSNSWPFEPGPPPTPASATFYNGSGINPACMNSTNTPVLGTTWNVLVDPTGHPGGAGLSGLLVYADSAAGPVLAGGELLVDVTSPFLTQSLVTSNGVNDLLPLAIPSNLAFLGRTGTCQGFTFSAGAGVFFCNAENVVLGF